MIKLLYFILAIIAIILVWFGSGVLIHQYYNWFVYNHVPGAPLLTFANCVGLGSFLGVIFTLSRQNWMEAPPEDDTRSDSDKIAHLLLKMFTFIMAGSILMLSGIILNKILY